MNDKILKHVVTTIVIAIVEEYLTQKKNVRNSIETIVFYQKSILVPKGCVRKD